MSKLPFKVRMFEWASQQNVPFTEEDIYNAMEKEYGSERQFSAKRIDTYLQSFIGSYMIKPVDLDLDENNNLVVTYTLTDFGKGRIKHIPKLNG